MSEWCRYRCALYGLLLVYHAHWREGTVFLQSRRLLLLLPTIGLVGQIPPCISKLGQLQLLLLGDNQFTGE
jgi:hypothetical protein